VSGTQAHKLHYKGYAQDLTSHATSTVLCTQHSL